MKLRLGLWVLLLHASFLTSGVAQGTPQRVPTELEQKADHAHGNDCVHLSIQAAKSLLEESNRHFAAGEVELAHQLIDATVHYGQRATECSVESRKSEKNTEIELRKLIHRMKDVAQTLDSEDRPHLDHAIAELERQRDVVLRAMFGAAAGSAKEKRP